MASLLPAEGSLGIVLLLAVIQGLTEFLPVSSSGHLVLAETLLGVEEARLALNVALHVGTLLAALAVYGRDLVRILAQLVGGRPGPALCLVVGTLPAVVFGLGLKLALEDALASPAVAGGGLLLTALLLVLGERARRRRTQVEPARVPDAPVLSLGWRTALVVGCAQAVAVLPGVSRSGSTIAAGLMRGVGPREAARFSFLLSVPAIAGAAVLELPGALEEGLAGLSAAGLAAAVALSAVVGLAALRLLLVVLERGAFGWFAPYCAVLGVVVLAVVGR